MPIVGVWPAEAAANRRVLLSALSRLLDVSFVPLNDVDGAKRGLSGVIIVSDPEVGADRGSRVYLPTLVLTPSTDASRTGVISLSHSQHLDPRLRGGSVVGEWSPIDVRGFSECEVLATVEGAPVWGRSRQHPAREVVSVDAPELMPGECLRDRLIPGKCLALLALLHFLRTIDGEKWSLPSQRAVFMVDDPNLRWRTYGHVNFSDIARHAARHNYHVSFATIPLDLRFFDVRVVKLFRAAHPHISLTMHGNNHTRQELRAVTSPGEADNLLAQAVRRTARFEARTNLPVSRVMVPPHEECAAPVLMELAKFGFESLASAGTWLGDLADAGQAQSDPIAGFEPSVVTDVGMPVLIRRDFAAHDEAMLKSFLDQPIILYGHATDFCEGLGSLEDSARVINRLPGVIWSDMSTLSRSCYLARAYGDELHIKPFARRLHVRLDPGLRAITVHPLVRDRQENDEPAAQRGRRLIPVRDVARSTIMLDAAPRVPELDIQLVADSRIDPYRVTQQPGVRRAVVRRFATETRDRTRPMLDRIRASARAAPDPRRTNLATGDLVPARNAGERPAP